MNQASEIASEIASDRAAVELAQAAQGFAAVGSEPRLEVLLALVRAGPAGLSVGEIQARLDVPSSTLTHHLKSLVAAGLVVQEKCGRTIRNHADYETITRLAQYLMKECCADMDGNGIRT